MLFLTLPDRREFFIGGARLEGSELRLGRLEGSGLEGSELRSTLFPTRLYVS